MNVGSGMMTNFEMVKEFNRVFGSYHQDSPKCPAHDVVDLRLKLLQEEYIELHNELIGEIPNNVDLEKVGKELCDLLFVTYGLADAFGLPVDAMFKEVYESNMSKLDKDGLPIYREDGKVMKGKFYKEPDLKQFLVEG